MILRDLTEMKSKKILIYGLVALTIGGCIVGFVTCNKKQKDAGSDLAYKLSSSRLYYNVVGLGQHNAEEKVVIPAQYSGKPVRGIESSAFQGTSIREIFIADTVTSIGDYAFRKCGALTSITVDAGNTKYSSLDGNLYDKEQTQLIQYAIGKTATSFTVPDSVTSICDWAFYECVYLQSVTIGDGVTSIGNMVFYWCENLTSVTIGKNVTSIGSYAFENCEKLTSITFKGSVEEWNAVEKGFYWDYEIPATEVICSDGTFSL